ncbi:MAG: hypothetical protein SFV52_06445 [Saprospiraceae bacterium]|nr:hypothetical protein [Saprospiraceae bacterium]
MMRIYFIILSGVLVCTAAAGQSLRSYERAADEAMQRRDYHAAMQYYAAVLERKKDDTGLWWKYAENARLYFALEAAEKGYQKVLAADPEHRKFPAAPFRMAQIRRMQGKYEEAVSLYDVYLAAAAPATYAAEAQQERDDCRWALEQTAVGRQPQIVHLDKKINSEYSDFGPALLGDTLYYSSYRFDTKRTRSAPSQKTTRLMRALPGARSRPPGRSFPDADTAHFAHTAFYADGTFLVFNQCKPADNGAIRCDLWLTVLDRNNRWIKPLRLPEPINLPGYTSTQPAIGYDSLLQAPVLWFASDRPGGQGGLDLWYVPLDTLWFCPCNRPLDARKAAFHPQFDIPPAPASELNTPGNDGTPFFHDPTQTLYFSSDARRGFGAYDVYATEKKPDNSWSEVYNLGPGVNTSYNDLYYFLRPDGLKGVLSSNRPGAYYLDPQNKACCNDLFEVNWPPPPPPKDTLTTPEPVPPTDTLPTVPPPPEQPGLEDFVGLPLYFDNDEPDPRTRRTSTRKNYEETVLRYLERQAEYKQNFANGLPEARKEDAEAAIDAFFEEEIRAGYERLTQFAALLLEKLQSGERVEVLVMGYTSPRAQSDYNLSLGQRRVSSVINYFQAYDNGVFKKFLDDKALRIAETSFGETKAAKGISDDIADRRNSVYHPAAARERRVEIVSVKRME